MRISKFLLLILIAVSAIGCQSHSGKTANHNANDSVPIKRVGFNPELLEGTWNLDNYNQSISFKEGRYYDPIETESNFTYRIKSDSLIIDNTGWGRQTFRILKLSEDTLKIRLIRQEIFDDSIDEEVSDDEDRVYLKDKTVRK